LVDSSEVGLHIFVAAPKRFIQVNYWQTVVVRSFHYCWIH